jgi:hypothetical protein
VDVRVGVTQSMRELEVELEDSADREALTNKINEALANPDGVLWLTDRKGREIAVPVGKIAYIEVGHPDEQRKVGFGA